MKKIFLAIAIFVTVSSYAQTDSSKLRSGKLLLRTNDWEYISSFIAFNEIYENMYDSIKSRLRPLSNANYPTGTTLVTVDSIENASLIAIALIIKSNYNKSTATSIDRIITAIRALNTPWINNQINAVELSEDLEFTNRRAEGKRRLRKQ